jgi:hypothetical protein
VSVSAIVTGLLQASASVVSAAPVLLHQRQKSSGCPDLSDDRLRLKIPTPEPYAGVVRGDPGSEPGDALALAGLLVEVLVLEQVQHRDAELAPGP